jgi:hypothetical protein
MKRIVLLLSLLSLVTLSISAQFRLNGPSRGQQNSSQGTQNKFYFGGGGGFGAGTDVNGNTYNYYSLMPILGYRIDAQFSVGASFTYQRYNYPAIGTSFTQYGFGPFLRYTINPLFFQAEYDVINAPAYNINNELVRSNYSRFLIGMGYVLPIGKRSAVNAMAMYDLLYKVPSVFNSPFVVRVFFVY